MFQIVVGPLLFAAGLCLIFLAVHGMPKGVSLARPRRTDARARAIRASLEPTMQPGDPIVGEMLSEMLTLREQIAELQEQVVQLRPRSRRKASAA
jgi:hypothetical protein